MIKNMYGEGNLENFRFSNPQRAIKSL